MEGRIHAASTTAALAKRHAVGPIVRRTTVPSALEGYDHAQAFVRISRGADAHRDVGRDRTGRGADE